MVPQKLGRCEVYKRVLARSPRAIQSLALRKKVFPLTVGIWGLLWEAAPNSDPVRTAYQRNDPIATPDVGFSRDALRGVVNREAEPATHRTVLGETLGRRTALQAPEKREGARFSVRVSGLNQTDDPYLA